jgi:hypothetical protein
VIKALDADALVYMGIDVVGSVGGVSSYETINADADLCSWHDYQATGAAGNVDSGTGQGWRALSKPLIIDETGVWAKSYYGSSGDSDTDDTGWPAVDYTAQGRLLERKMASFLAMDGVVGILDYSYMDSDGGGQTDGEGHYEPLNESLARKVIRTVPLAGDEFSVDVLSGLSGSGAWVDGVQAFRYAPGADVDTLIQRQVNNALSISGSNPTAGRYGHCASLLFDGTQYADYNPWKCGASATTQWFAFVPTTLPDSGSYAYLVAPQTASTSVAIRINSDGEVEVLTYAAATTGTVESTSTNAVVLGQVNLLAVPWSTSTGDLDIILNSVLTSATGKTATLTAKNGRLGAASDGTNGLVGHLLEVIQVQSVETDTNIGRTLAYLARRYGLDGVESAASVSSADVSDAIDAALATAAPMQVVDAGSDDSTARPSGAAAVYWICDNGVTPTNAVDGDLIYNADA